MDLEQLVDALGERWVLMLGGAMIGAIFGAFAQQSRFCLRAAAVEFSRGSLGPKLAIWLLVFTTAVAGTAALMHFDIVNLQEARQLASPQSISGAAIGGMMFGIGMVLARGCSSRLLVLSATGNLRALRNHTKRIAWGLEDGQAAPGLKEQLERVERGIIQDALRRHAGHATETARALNLPRKTFYDRLQKLGIRAESYRD